jgi:hypothetical protein
LEQISGKAATFEDLERSETTIVEFKAGTGRLDVASHEPNEGSNFKLGCRKMMLIIIFCHVLVGVSEFSAELGVDGIESCSEIRSRGVGRAFRDYRGESRMIAEIGEERSLLSGDVLSVVEGKLGKGEVVNPVVLLV